MLAHKLASSPTGDPFYQKHSAVLHAILAQLLPPHTSDAPAPLHSTETLRAAVGPVDEGAMTEALNILCNDMRLIVPVEVMTPAGSECNYRLAHEFLGPVIREWLERTERASPRARTALALKDLSAMWMSSGRHDYFLPRLSDLLRFEFRLRSDKRNVRAFLNAGWRHHLLRTLLPASMILVGLSVFAVANYRQRTHELLEQLKMTSLTNAPLVAKRLSSRIAAPAALRGEYLSATDAAQRLKLEIALVPLDAAVREHVFTTMLSAPPEEVRVLVEELFPFRASFVSRLWNALAQPREGGNDWHLQAFTAHRN